MIKLYYMNNGLDRGAGFISTRKIAGNDPLKAHFYTIVCRKAASDGFSVCVIYAVKKRDRGRICRCIWERGDRRRNHVFPCDTVSGTQQNMLRTVTSVERYHGI